MKKFIVSEAVILRLACEADVLVRYNESDQTFSLALNSAMAPGETERAEHYIPSEYTAIGPLDGRYNEIAKKLSPYFSEFALVKNRVKVEVYWLQFLLDNLDSVIIAKVKKANPKINVMGIFNGFNYDDFGEIKKIESEINHDVKAVEIWVARKVEEMGYPELKSYVHIGCTSEDITNPAYARMIKDSLNEQWYPKLNSLIEVLQKMSLEYQETPMLAHTHGQPASPTTVGKELCVYVYRLKEALKRIRAIKPLAKFNGATGNYSAISFAFPGRDWTELARRFVKVYLELEFNPVTTQIESHDYIVEIASEMAHINRIISNLCSDMWTYISMEYFSQVPVKKEVGSSTMPHKVNPINFENGEMNLRKSTSDLEFLSEWLMSSRMQRDLRDSTALRNIGVAFGHSLLGIDRVIKGLERVKVNEKAINESLCRKWEVLAEAIQTVLRKYGIADAYDKLKELTRGKEITREALSDFLLSEELSVIPKCELEALVTFRPEDYTGLAGDIVCFHNFE